MISNQTVIEFKEAISAEFGVVLNEVEAKEILLNWVGYFDLLLKIDQRKEAQIS